MEVSNTREPRFVKAVETDCGSHTHTLVPDLARKRVLLYVSSFASAGGPRCGPGRAENPMHAKISIVAVPLATPDQAAVVATPEVRAPVFIAGRRANPTIGCHDISVFLPRRLAAASCMTEGQLWDISNPLRPRTLARIRNRDFEFWHSATFSNDGKIVVFGDESLSSSCGSEADRDGRLWFYEIARPARPLGSFMIAPRVVEYCSVHMFNTIPLSGRSLLASGWYDGGSHVVDFGNPRRPREVAGRVPEGASEWASYWYNGAIYASDMERGLDVFSLTLPGLAKAKRLPRLNPQTQEILIR